MLRVIAAGLNPETCSVVRVMTPHPDTANPHTTIMEALRRMHGTRSKLLYLSFLLFAHLLTCSLFLSLSLPLSLSRWTLSQSARTRLGNGCRHGWCTETYLCNLGAGKYRVSFDVKTSRNLPIHCRSMAWKEMTEKVRSTFVKIKVTLVLTVLSA